jgi:hypothetical protein
MAGVWLAWSEHPVPQHEALEETEVGATQQEAPEELDVGDEANDLSQVTYMLVQF